MADLYINIENHQNAAKPTVEQEINAGSNFCTTNIVAVLSR